VPSPEREGDQQVRVVRSLAYRQVRVLVQPGYLEVQEQAESRHARAGSRGSLDEQPSGTPKDEPLNGPAEDEQAPVSRAQRVLLRIASFEPSAVADFPVQAAELGG